MKQQLSNPCTRCGKERIITKTWTEKMDTFFGTSTVTHTETSCPDPECQKIVEEKNLMLKQKKEQMEQDRQDRLKRAQKNRQHE